MSSSRSGATSVPSRAVGGVGAHRLASVMALAAASAAVAAGMAAGAALAAEGGLGRLAGLREEVVLQGAIVDGSRLDVNRFTDRRTPEQLRSEIRRLWMPRQAPVHEFERDGWLVLVQAVDAAVETVEMQARGSGSSGRRTRLSRAGLAVVDAAAWLDDILPSQSRVLRRITHRDGSRHMTTLVALTRIPPSATSQVLVAALASRGFQAHGGAVPSFSGASGGARFLSRGGEELALGISKQDGGSAVVVHWGRAGR